MGILFGTSKFHPHGTFAANANQTVANATTAYAVAFDEHVDMEGLTHDNETNNSRIYVIKHGVYEFIPSIIYDSNTQGHELNVWFAIGGVNVASSNTRVQVASASAEGILSVAFTWHMDAGQYIELMYSGNNTNVVLRYTAAQENPTRPAAPAVLMTVKKISS